MFAFSPDRHAVHLHTSSNGEATRRSVRTGVSQPGSQPGTNGVSTSTPAPAPTEPSHERAFPQADGVP
jgi:hypothetical protein